MIQKITDQMNADTMRPDLSNEIDKTVLEELVI